MSVDDEGEPRVAAGARGSPPSRPGTGRGRLSSSSGVGPELSRRKSRVAFSVPAELR
jgi:hypothetical protein